MKATELRIGNLLRDKLTGAILRVDELNSEGKIVTYVIDRSKYPLPKGWQLDYIPLTEDVFNKCVHGQDSYETFKRKQSSLGDCLIYLHQLQNLVFFTTGKELEINL
ncbi:MAG: hypothetical protein J7577_00765 [Sphingobacteriaceae bacterium]|nr:hypothetical protein [Sphingobacteriaceae bacterium]